MSARRASRALVLGLVVGVLAACGLPLQDGVGSPGRVSGDAQEPGGSQVLPPGPQPDAGARAIVQGFLDAQANPDDDHAKAREFLHPDVREAWDDGRVLVREPDSEVVVDPGDPSRVVVRTAVVAGIADDGSFSLQSERREEVYRVRPDAEGQLRLSEVPEGLRLVIEDVASSFRTYDVHFLRSSPGLERPRLVPDRVFVPVDSDPADALVRHLLAGPSASLTNAVSSAVPVGTALRGPVTTADGVVTVDLTREVAAASPDARRDLSAQLVWTLRGTGQVFTALRLLVEGRPLDVEGAPDVQDRDQWSAYDPDRLDEGGGLLLVRDGRVSALTGSAVGGEAGDGRLAVEQVVASPAAPVLALLSAGEGGDSVRTGPLRGPTTEVLAGGQVGSLSWGSGDDGLWVVRGGAEPQVLLVPPAPASPAAVPYVRPVGTGPLAALRVSRDGARVAAVFGAGADRQVFVGRVERVADAPGVRLAGFRAVAPQLTDVADVGWESGTSLVVLGALGTANRLPVRVAVDGSALEPVRTLGLDGEPQALTVAPGRPLVVGTLLADRPVLFVEEQGLFRGPQPGSAPAYPG